MSLGGQIVRASSPQGRFIEGASRLDGKRLREVWAHGKHLFVGFGSDSNETASDSLCWLHVHLGIYGSWRFTGDECFNAAVSAGEVTLGEPLSVQCQQTGCARRGDNLQDRVVYEVLTHFSVDDSQWAPHEHFADRWFMMPGDFCPVTPIGTVRLRLLTSHGQADLSGPNRCELLDWEEVQEICQRLGPDPLSEEPGFDNFVRLVATRKKGIGEALMDQSVIAGVGNIYRAEALYAVGLSPFVSARDVPPATLKKLWEWLKYFMPLGVESGRVTTIDAEDYADYVERQAARDYEVKPIDSRYYVYQRNERPCIRCDETVRLKIVGGRKLYWCPRCQG